MKNKIITTSIIVILIILMIISIGTIKNKKENTEDIKLIKVNEVTRSVFYAPQYVAINNGYFKENGFRKIINNKM